MPVRNENSNDVYMPICFKVVPERKKDILYVPMHFEKGLTIDALVDSGLYVSTIAQK